MHILHMKALMEGGGGGFIDQGYHDDFNSIDWRGYHELCSGRRSFFR